jgi:transcriptional regulator with XRE-family HTH domain
MFGDMHPETQRLINLLKVSLRILGVSNRELAKRLEMSPSYVSKLLSGASELRLEHLMCICDAIGILPAEFFALAYPVPVTKASLTAKRLRELLQSVSPYSPPALKPEVSEEQVQEMLRAALERLMRGGG